MDQAYISCDTVAISIDHCGYVCGSRPQSSASPATHVFQRQWIGVSKAAHRARLCAQIPAPHYPHSAFCAQSSAPLPLRAPVALGARSRCRSRRRRRLLPRRIVVGAEAAGRWTLHPMRWLRHLGCHHRSHRRLHCRWGPFCCLCSSGGTHGLLWGWRCREGSDDP